MGASYADIARAGGGIQSTVRATRAATEDELAAQSARRLCGTRAPMASPRSRSNRATASIRTARCKQLQSRARLAAECRRRRAHDIARRARVAARICGRSDDYIDMVCREMIPAIASAGLADAVDAFCETIAFTRSADAARVCRGARERPAGQAACRPTVGWGWRRGRGRVRRVVCRSSRTHERCRAIAAMARAGTVAVLLPGAFYALRETRLPPIDALRAHGVPIAIATDCNPGTSPTTSLAADAQHGVHAVPTDTGRSAGRRNDGTRRARSA